MYFLPTLANTFQRVGSKVIVLHLFNAAIDDFTQVILRISVMVISRFGERDQFGRWCCAVNEL
jgi:hypothetical protein